MGNGTMGVMERGDYGNHGQGGLWGPQERGLWEADSDGMRCMPVSSTTLQRHSSTCCNPGSLGKVQINLWQLQDRNRNLFHWRDELHETGRRLVPKDIRFTQLTVL